MTREVDEIACRRENALGAFGDVDADSREHDFARAPFDQVGADLPLQFADLHRQRRLSDGAFLGGAAKMPVAGERGEITQLTQGDHIDFPIDKLCLSAGAINTIGPDWQGSLQDRHACPTMTGRQLQPTRKNAQSKHDRREPWTRRLTTRARANAHSPEPADRETATGGRTRWISKCSIATPRCPIRWARISIMPRSSRHSTSMA